LKTSEFSGEFVADRKKSLDPNAEPQEEISKTVFDKIIQTYQHLRKTMLKEIVYTVMVEVKSRSQAYKKEKVAAMIRQRLNG
jgi:hypothetical protein